MIAAVFLLQSLMLKEEPRDSSGVFAACTMARKELGEYK